MKRYDVLFVKDIHELKTGRFVLLKDIKEFNKRLREKMGKLANFDIIMDNLEKEMGV